MSATMTRAVPALAAPITADRPTPPAPTTSTASPTVTWARLIAAPKPVLRPQAARQAISNGTPVSIWTAFQRSTTAYSANDDCIR